MELLHNPGEIISQRYCIVDTLGQGGSGTTYQAEDLQTNQRVALKALSLHRMTDWKMIELFEREARVLAQLNHPSIPKYLDYFHVDTPQDRWFYIAQQLAPGKSLTELVQSGWRGNESVIRRIAIQVLEILVYLHELTPPVIHRDIKPSNIIWHSDGQVFLVDFGAVQDTYHNTFMRGSTVVGTYGYMAPEQFRGQAVSTTDLYGVGATLLFLLTNRSPADLPTDRLKIDFRSRVQVSEELADWLEKMLEPDVEDRFSSAKEALAVLHGKRRMRVKSRSSLPWKAIAGVGVAIVAVVNVVNSYKYALLDSLGFTEFIQEAVYTGEIDPQNYIAAGGNFNFKDSQGLTLLHKIAQQGSIDAVEMLIAKGVDVNAKDNEGKTPLYRVSSKEVAELLIAKGAEINVEDNTGITPLGSALRSLNMDTASLLIGRGAQFSNRETKTKDGNGNTLLHYAVENNSKKMVQLLIAKGADVNVQDVNGNTSLYRAVSNNNKEMALLLIAKGADVNVGSDDGNTSLRRAVWNNNKEMAQLLIAKGADVNVQGINGNTLLHYAVEKNSKEMAQLLIAKGADVNVGNYNGGNTSLHKAVWNNNKEMAQLLIAKGADVNAKNSSGNTLLHYTVRDNRKEMAQLLIAKGADINARDSDGNTPLGLARRGGNQTKDVAELLKQHGATE